MPKTLDLLLPNHDGPAHPYSTLQIEGIVLIVVLTFIAVVAGGLRVYSRTITKTCGLDDWLVWTATLLTVNQCWANILFMRSAYIGVHKADIPAQAPHDEWLWNWLGQVFYIPILGLAKNSVLVFLLRLGGRQRRGVRLAIYALLAFNTAKTIAVTAVIFFRCTPIYLDWSEAYYSPHAMAHCNNLRFFWMMSGALNIFTDILVLILPFLIFLDMQINKKLRNALIGVFLLGLTVPIFSCVRVYYFYVYLYAPSADPIHSLGYTTSAVESNVAIIAATVPALWPVARRWFPSIDDTLGVNRHHQADIEVQTLGDLDPAAAGAGPPRVKVTWIRANKVRRDQQQQQHPESANRVSSTFASPRPSPQIRQSCEGTTQQDDYFGGAGSRNSSSHLIGGRDRDSYHSMITDSGQPRPWGTLRHQVLGEAFYSAKRAQLESDSTASILPEARTPAFQLTMPPRVKKATTAAAALDSEP